MLSEDLVAEAFARAWAQRPKVRRLAEPRAWVIRVALNAPRIGLAAAPARGRAGIR